MSVDVKLLIENKRRSAKSYLVTIVQKGREIGLQSLLVYVGEIGALHIREIVLVAL